MIKLSKIDFYKNKISKVIGNIFFILLLSCYEIPDNYSVEYYPHVTIITSSDSIFTMDSSGSSYRSSDTLIIDYSRVTAPLVNINDIFKMNFHDTLNPSEGYFDITMVDTFHIRITSASEAHKKVFPVFNTNNVQIISSDTLIGKDNLYINEFSFKAKSPSKGYICFSETQVDSRKLTEGFPIYEYSNVFLICYCISKPEKVFVKIDSLIWSYLLDINGQDTLWDLNRVTIKGKTNAFSLGFFVSSASSSLISEQMYNSTINKDSSFTITYEGWEIDKMKFELYVRAFPGFDKVIKLIPPKNKIGNSD